MRNNRLIDLLKSLNKRDLKELEQFLSFVVPSMSSPINKLFFYLKKHHPYQKECKIAPKVIFDAIWNDKEYDPSNKALSNLEGRLQKEIRTFLQYKELQKSTVFQRFLYANSPAIKGNQSLFLNNSSKWLTAIDNDKDSVDLYYHRVKYHELNFYYGVKDSLNGISEHYDGVLTNVDLYYISYKLKMYCEGVSIKSLFSQEISTPNSIIEDFLAHSLPYQNKKHPLLHIYIKMAFFLKGEQTVRELEVLIKLIKEYQPKIEDRSIIEVFLLINNYCIRQRFNGITVYDNTLFNVARWIVALGFLDEAPFFTSSLYINIIYAAVNVGNISFAERYKNDKIYLIKADENEDAFFLAEAICFCSKGEYTKAITSLGKITAFHYRYRLRKQFLLLKNEFELFVLNMDREEDLDNRITAYTNFFAREKKISVERKENCLNLSRFLRKLKKLYLGIDKTVALKLEKELEILSVINKPWLKEKLKKGIIMTPLD